MKKMEMKTRDYTAPTVKVVDFTVEHGFAGSLETRSINPQTLGGRGDVAGDGEQYSRITFEGWGNNSNN